MVTVYSPTASIYRSAVPTDADAVKILQSYMQVLEEQMRKIPPATLEKQTGMLWARKLDYTYEGKKKSLELEHDTRKAAAYILIDQILFYHILSLQAPEYPPLEDLSGTDPSPLCKYFEKVLFQDYQAVFDINILSLLPKTAEMTRALNFIIQTCKRSKIGEIRQDILGKIFHQLIPMEIRRHLAAFYTSNEAAALLAHLAITRGDEKVLDLACGSGTLLTEAYLRKKTLLQESNAQVGHREILSQIYGNDVTQFAAHLATINLAIQGSLSRAERVNVTAGDGFEISPATLMEHTDALKMHRPALDGSSEQIVNFTGIDVIFMNPPFTQHKRLNPEEKEKIHAILRQENLGKFLDGRMGLHALFILHADVFLPVGGKMALVIPATTFSSNYGKKILQLFLKKNYSIDYLVERVGSTNAFSEQCGLKEILLVVTKGYRQERGCVTKLVTLNNMPAYEEISLLANELKDWKGSEQSERLNQFDATIISIPQDTLLNTTNWYSLLQKNVTDLAPSSVLLSFFGDPEKFTLSGKNTGFTIRRGFDGTHIEELSLPSRTWAVVDALPTQSLVIEHRMTKERLIVPRENYLKSFRLPRLYERIFTPRPQEFLLVIPENPPMLGDIARYVEIMTEQLSSRRLKEKKEGAARSRTLNLEWYSHTSRFKSQDRVGHLWIVWKFNIKTRRGFGFFAVEAGAAHNAFYQVTCPKPEWEPLLAAWFNSSLWVYQLMVHARSLTSQYHQLMIEDMKKAFFPRLERVDHASIERILSAARAVDQEKGDSFRELFLAGKMDTLDRVWLEALHFPPKDVAGIQQELRNFFLGIFARFNDG